VAEGGIVRAQLRLAEHRVAHDRDHRLGTMTVGKNAHGMRDRPRRDDLGDGCPPKLRLWWGQRAGLLGARWGEHLGVFAGAQRCIPCSERLTQLHKGRVAISAVSRARHPFGVRGGNVTAPVVRLGDTDQPGSASKNVARPRWNLLPQVVSLGRVERVRAAGR
jgi:hypothetical protein